MEESEENTDVLDWGVLFSLVRLSWTEPTRFSRALIDRYAFEQDMRTEKTSVIVSVALLPKLDFMSWTGIKMCLVYSVGGTGKLNQGGRIVLFHRLSILLLIRWRIEYTSRSFWLFSCHLGARMFGPYADLY